MKVVEGPTPKGRRMRHALVEHCCPSLYVLLQAEVFGGVGGGILSNSTSGLCPRVNDKDPSPNGRSPIKFSYRGR